MAPSCQVPPPSSMWLSRAPIPAFAAAVALLAAAPASAPATFSVATQANPSFGLTLNGTDQTGVSTIVLRVTQTDSGANGKTGWNVTMTSTPFQAASGSRLTANATSLVSSGSTCAVGPCTDPVSTVGRPVAIPAGSPPPAAVKAFNAAQSSGMGVFDLTGNLQTTVPANADAGAYTSTMTVSLVRGP